MFEALSHPALQHYWWIIVSLLAALLVFLLFVQGGQTLLGCLSTNEEEKSILVNILGRKWEFTFTTLVTFGGAMFAAFPKFYATSFGGAYWLWMIILFCFIIQAVSYEYRRKPGNFLGPKTYETFLFINGSLGVFMLGVAVATFFTGSQFQLVGDFRQVEWLTAFHGLEAVLSIHNVSLGLAIVFLARTLASQYIINSINDENIENKAVKQVKLNAVLFLLFFLTFFILLILKDGFAINPENGLIFMESTKYFNNLIEMPFLLLLLLTGVVLVIFGFGISAFTKRRTGIWFSGIGTVLTVFSLFIVAGFNNTAFYPSTADLQSSLTIFNSSSSRYTLIVMSYASLMMPFVFAYIFYTWKAINKKKLDKTEPKSEEHKY